MTEVFAVVVTYNGAPWLKRCLDSLRGSEHPVSIVVVDNASQDDSAAIARSVDGVEVIQHCKNLGFGKANNVGIAYALRKGAEFVFLLNQDAEIERNTISELLCFMCHRADAGVTSPVHLNGSGTLLDSNFLLHYLAPQAPQFIYDAYSGDLACCYKVSSANAAAWLVSRQCLEGVGGFDPIFFMYGEDDDFCVRMAYHGYSFYVVSQARIRHARGFHQLAYRGSAWSRLLKGASFKRAKAIRLLKDPSDRSMLRPAYRMLTSLVLEGLSQSLASLSPSPFLSSIFAAAKVCWELPRIARHKRACQSRGPTWLQCPVDLIPVDAGRRGLRDVGQSYVTPWPRPSSTQSDTGYATGRDASTEIPSPIVTEGVPIYNGAMFLEGALDSLLSQTFDNFEIVLSDNGSDDGTEEICRRYAAMDRRIRYFRHDVNRGAAWNHNFLITEARGRFFRWHHCDDLCESRHLECCVAALESEPMAVLAYPRTMLIDAVGKITASYEDRLALGEETPHARLRHLLHNVYLCNAVLGVMRVEVLRRTGLHGAYIAADHVLLAELAMQGRFIEVPEALFLRRMHPGKSTEVNRTNRDRAAFEDPRLRNARFFFPNLRLFGERLRAVWRAKIGLREQLLCAAVVGEWHCRFEVGRFRARAPRILGRIANRLRVGIGTGGG
ncbi:MAG: glycosyltransferase [Burkholderiales bacterium]